MSHRRRVNTPRTRRQRCVIGWNKGRPRRNEPSPPPKWWMKHTVECMPCTLAVFPPGPHYGTVDWMPKARIHHAVDFECPRKAES